MEKYFNILKAVKLFRGINEKDLSAMLSCLRARIITPSKDVFILMAGDKVSEIGIVLEGSVHITRDDIDGERTRIAALETGDFFGEALCCASVLSSPISVQTTSNATIMLLEYGRILRSCSNSCLFHSKLIENMLLVVAEKNLMLQDRMDIMSKKTLRLKICRLLESFAQKQGRNIKIPFNREQLAEYICVDRSALSHELSRMKQDGLIDYYKNNFKLLYQNNSDKA